MPTHDYVCSDCGEVEEVLFKYPNPPPIERECRHCGAMAKRQAPIPTTIQTGYKPGDARFNRGKGR